MFSRLTAMDSPCWLVCSDGTLEQVKIKDVFLYKAFILFDDVIVESLCFGFDGNLFITSS